MNNYTYIKLMSKVTNNVICNILYEGNFSSHRTFNFIFEYF